ncbi:MAG TPA: hypothetical protein VG713_11875, partial [Pirellulales bacterium]|nr:hypothetical protein [Pirellulales bacterium]
MKYNLELDGIGDSAARQLTIADITPPAGGSAVATPQVASSEAQAAEAYNLPERATLSDIRYIARNFLTSAPLALSDLVAFASCLVVVSVACSWLNPAFESYVSKWWLPLI